VSPSSTMPQKASPRPMSPEGGRQETGKNQEQDNPLVVSNQSYGSAFFVFLDITADQVNVGKSHDELTLLIDHFDLLVD
jgi:hypothetical protein